MIWIFHLEFTILESSMALKINKNHQVHRTEKYSYYSKDINLKCNKKINKNLKNEDILRIHIKQLKQVEDTYETN